LHLWRELESTVFLGPDVDEFRRKRGVGVNRNRQSVRIAVKRLFIFPTGLAAILRIEPSEESEPPKLFVAGGDSIKSD
jgi:hypothetical protein